MTVTVWDSERSVKQPEASDRYRQVVRSIEDSGIPGDQHQTEAYRVYGGYADSELSSLLAALG